MLKLFIALSISSLLVACAENNESTPASISINNGNASRFSALGFQQFLALHSNSALVRNTISANPNYNSPCSSGGYAANFEDLDNTVSLTAGDRISETYTNCEFNTGNITVSGRSSSTVNSFSSGTYGLTTQHSSLVVTTLGNGKSYTFNGSIQAVVKNEFTLLNIENLYRNYTVGFAGESTTINSGSANITVNSADNGYAIQHSLIFSTSRTTGLLRTDTTTEVGGLSINNELLFAGDPTISAADEDTDIQSKKDELAAAQAENPQDPAAIAQLEADIFALENARKAFRPFEGRLRIESVIDGHFVEMTSLDSDDDATTYLQNVRANRATTATLGNKWADLL